MNILKGPGRRLRDPSIIICDMTPGKLYFLTGPTRVSASQVKPIKSATWLDKGLIFMYIKDDTEKNSWHILTCDGRVYYIYNKTAFKVQKIPFTPEELRASHWF